MTPEECRELAALHREYGVTFADYTRSLSAATVIVMLEALSGSDAPKPRGSAFAQPPDLDWE